MAETKVSPAEMQLPYKAKVRLSANQSISDNVTTTITLDTEDFDTGNNFSANKFTAPVAGFYQINFHTYMSTAGQGVGFTAYVRKNNSIFVSLTQVPYPAVTTYGGASVSYSELLQLAAGDYIDFAAQIDTVNGSAATVVGGSDNTGASFYLVSTA